MEETQRAQKDQRPFQPFEIRTADGRSVTVRNPDAPARDDPESPRTVAGLGEGGGWESIDMASITTLARPAEGSPVGDAAA
jgi:hypothetical protein